MTPMSACRTRRPSGSAMTQALHPLPPHEPLAFQAVSEAETLRRVRAFEAMLRRRRTVRDFAPDPVSREVIEAAIRAAGSAPSGANQQPWSFVAIADPAIKARIPGAAGGGGGAGDGGRGGAG